MNNAVFSIHFVNIRWLILLAMYSIAYLFPVATQAQPGITSQEEDVREWYYTLRPSDSLQRISQDLLNQQHSWTDLVRYNKIDDVASLEPGTIIRVPMHWLKQQPKPAVVISVSGNVMIKRIAASQFQVMKPDMAIQVGDEVMTRNGSVLIKFADSSIIRLDRNSSLVFNKLSHFGHTGMVDTRMRLNKGSLSTDVVPLVKGSRYEISTPSAVAAVRGTQFRMSANNKSTQIEVTEGSVELSHAHGTALINEGEGARIRQGSAIIEQSKLAPAPEPQFANEVISDLPATLTWKDKQNASQFRYQLIDKGNRDREVQTATLPKPEVTLNHVKNGEYQVAMRSVNENGFEGMNAKSSLKINIADVITELLEPLDGSILDTQKPLFKWKFGGKESLSKLQIANDPDFDTILNTTDYALADQSELGNALVPGRYFWRVATLADDGDESFTAPRTLSIRGLMEPIEILSVNYIGDQVGLFWKNIEKSNGYVLQVSDSLNFSNILREETLNKSNAHLKLTAGKHYYARVKGIGDDLYRSDFGPVKELMIKAP